MLEIAKSAIVCTLLGNLVSSALDILLSNGIEPTSTLVLPVSDTVHWLRALLIGALLNLVLEWASISIVGSRNGDPVCSASLVVVIFLFVEAFTVSIPSTNAINRLRTTRGRALLKLVGISTVITVVSSTGGDLVVSAPPVLVVLGVMVARSIRTPSSSTVHGLRATTGRALLIVVVVWAAITVVSSVLAVLVVPAPPVLVVRAVMLAATVRSPSSSSVHWL